MKKYVEPGIEVLKFDAEDIITESSAEGNFDIGDDAVITIKSNNAVKMYTDME